MTHTGENGPSFTFNEPYFRDLDGPLPHGGGNKLHLPWFSAFDVPSPLVAPWRLQESGIFAIAIWADHRFIAMGLIAMRLVPRGFCPTPTRAAATHLYILV